jgi:hypothetical protein
MLGLRADAPHKRLYVNPTLPDWLPDIELRQMRVGPSVIDLRFWREGKRSRWEIRDIMTDKFQYPQAGPEHTWPAAAPLEQQNTGQTQKSQVSRYKGVAQEDAIQVMDDPERNFK